MIDKESTELTLQRQCDLVGLPRSSFYYKPASETPLNLEWMRKIDEIYLTYPFYGIERVCAELRTQGYPVNRKRIKAPDAPNGAFSAVSQAEFEQTEPGLR